MSHQRSRSHAGPDTSDGLVAVLAAELRPVEPMTPATLRDVLLVGAMVATALFFAVSGLRADIGPALFSGAFWLKLVYTTVAAWLAWTAVRDLGRPGAIWRAPWSLTLPFLGLATSVVADAAGNATASTAQYWVSASTPRCEIIIFLLASPIAAGLLWSLRDMAPVHTRIAGFLAGLVAGAVGAAIYSLGCGETSPGFVLVWYSLGMLLPALTSALIAPSILRW